MEVLQHIPTDLTVDDVLQHMRSRKASPQMRQIVGEVLDLVVPIAKPKALYQVAYVSRESEDIVSLNGVRFCSHVMRVNFDSIERVFPFVTTCGKEADSVQLDGQDILKTYCLDAVKELLMLSARQYLKQHIASKYAPGRLSHMAPGSLKDWPITQQRPLFSLFGDVEALIGVTLTDSCLMIPVKSTSGIYFPTEVEYENCQLCPRTACPRRRAPYDADLYNRFGLG